MTKKSFVKRFAKAIRDIHKRDVVIRCDIQTDREVMDLINASTKTNTIFLIPKNGNNGCLFTPEKICIIVHDDRGTFIGKECNPKFVLENMMDECQICYSQVTAHNGRQCSNCPKTFCVSCHIKLVINGLQQQEFKCPFCWHCEVFPKYLSMENLVDSIAMRVRKELADGVITTKEAKRLWNYLFKEIYGLETPLEEWRDDQDNIVNEDDSDWEDED